MRKIVEPWKVLLEKAQPKEFAIPLPSFFTDYFGLEEGDEFSLSGKRTRKHVVITLTTENKAGNRKRLD